MQIKLFKNEQLANFNGDTVDQSMVTSILNYELRHEGTMNRSKKVYQFKTIFCLVGHNF